MKVRLLGVMGLSLWCMQGFAADATQPSLNTEKDKISYSIGVDIGQTLKAQGIDVNPAVLNLGLENVVENKPLLLNDQQRQDTMRKFQKELMAKREAEVKLVAENNKKASEDFLDANKAKPGVVTLADGLQYKIIKEGTGSTPKDTDLVTVNYKGEFVNGTEFDSSYKRGKPAVFAVSKNLIPAWTEALKLMKPGSVWELYVPPKLGYGERGVGPIGPNQALVFKIELISFKPADKEVKKS